MTTVPPPRSPGDDAELRRKVSAAICPNKPDLPCWYCRTDSDSCVTTIIDLVREFTPVATVPQETGTKVIDYEGAARALYSSATGDRELPWGATSFRHKERYRQHARAVIEFITFDRAISLADKGVMP